LVNVDEYLKQAGGPFLRAQHVQIGDKLQILDEGTIDDKSFTDKQGRPRAYLIFRVKLLKNNEEYLLRLGPRNTKRIRDSFGTADTKQWVNRLLEVVGIEEYSGLGQKGILLRGVPPEPKQTQITAVNQPPLSDETLKFLKEQRELVEAGVDLGLPLNESDFNLIPINIRAELLKHGLIEKTNDGYFWEPKAKEFLK